MIEGEVLTGFGCPECEAKTKVIDTRCCPTETKTGLEDMLRRRRKCLACELRFTTYEIAAMNKSGAYLKANRDKFEKAIDQLQSVVNFLKTLIQE